MSQNRFLCPMCSAIFTAEDGQTQCPSCQRPLTLDSSFDPANHTDAPMDDLELVGQLDDGTDYGELVEIVPLCSCPGGPKPDWSGLKCKCCTYEIE